MTTTAGQDAAALPGAGHDTVSAIRYVDTNGRVSLSTQGGAGADTPFVLASVGKMMTAAVVLQLVAEGALTLDGPARQWLAGDLVQGLGGLDCITMRHLLTMRSGLPEYLNNAYVTDALGDPGRVQKAAVAVSYAYGLEPLFPPGADFHYSNTNYVLLGLILEQVTRRSYASVLTERLFRPLGMGASLVFGSAPLPANFPDGHHHGMLVRDCYRFPGFGDGGVIATAPDLVRFCRALLVTRDLLPAALLDQMTTAVGDIPYGMGIEVEAGVLGHSGGDLGFSSDVRVDPQTGTVAVAFAASADADLGWTLDAIAAAADRHRPGGTAG